MTTRVLAFMAHPDDIEFTCAGTLIRLSAEADCHITLATATSGDCGSADQRPDEIARIRHEEAKASAAVINADYYCAQQRDLMIMYDEPTLKQFIELIRKSQPDIVITQPPADYMADHEHVSRLVRMACFSAPVPNISTYDADPAPPLQRVPYLYYVDPLELKHPITGEVVEPSFVVDVSSVIDRKAQMLACHASQREWLRAHHGMDEYIEMMKRTGIARGKLIGRDYGEGFTQHLGHPHPQNNRILELLSSA
jgi:LmbE family N-acetylglucosaminyl deacetylase